MKPMCLLSDLQAEISTMQSVYHTIIIIILSLHLPLSLTLCTHTPIYYLSVAAHNSEQGSRCDIIMLVYACSIIGARVSEPPRPLVDSTDALSR